MMIKGCAQFLAFCIVGFIALCVWVGSEFDSTRTVYSAEIHERMRTDPNDSKLLGRHEAFALERRTLVGKLKAYKSQRSRADMEHFSASRKLEKEQAKLSTMTPFHYGADTVKTEIYRLKLKVSAELQKFAKYNRLVKETERELAKMDRIKAAQTEEYERRYSEIKESIIAERIAAVEARAAGSVAKGTAEGTGRCGPGE